MSDFLAMLIGRSIQIFTFLLVVVGIPVGIWEIVDDHRREKEERRRNTLKYEQGLERERRARERREEQARQRAREEWERELDAIGELAEREEELREQGATHPGLARDYADLEPSARERRWREPEQHARPPGPALQRGGIHVINPYAPRGTGPSGRHPAIIVSGDAANTSAHLLGHGKITIVPLGPGTGARPPAFHVPVSTDRDEPDLAEAAVARTEQVRTIEVQRLGEHLGTLSAEELEQVDDALRLHLGL